MQKPAKVSFLNEPVSLYDFLQDPWLVYKTDHFPTIVPIHVNNICCQNVVQLSKHILFGDILQKCLMFLLGQGALKESGFWQI